MTTQELISDLQVRGARFEVSDESCTIKAPQGLITAELRELLTERKPEIIALLTRAETQIEARFFKGLDCPQCKKPVEVITHPLDEEVWLHCIDPECLIKTLHHDNREWCRDCGQKLNVIAGRCVDCLRRVLLSPNDPCQRCSGGQFWRQKASTARTAGNAWHCATCNEPPENAVYFALPGLAERG